MEKIQIIYKNGTNMVIDACNGAYNAIKNELTKKKPAKYAMPPEKSRYKYCVSLENIMCVNKITVEQPSKIGFTHDSAKNNKSKKSSLGQ